MISWFNDLLAALLVIVSQGDMRALVVLLLMSALTEMGIPFPFVVDSVLVVAGYQNGLWSLPVGKIVLFLILGRLIGAAVIYWLSRYLGVRFINWVVKRFPKLLTGMTWLNTKLSRRAPLAIAIARLTPGILTSSSIAAGCIRMSFPQFMLGIILASIIADASLLLLGFSTGYGLKWFGFTPAPWMLVVIAVAVIALIWLLRWLWQRWRNLKSRNGTAPM
jgi:membrane protein DedA with SNARE-associated domain